MPRAIPDIQTVSSVMKGNAMRTLATFDNAYRVAGRLSDAAGGSFVILATSDPEQPHRVERATGQPNAIACIAVADVGVDLRADLLTS